MNIGIYHEGEGEEKKAYYLEWEDPARIGELCYGNATPYYCIKPGSGEYDDTEKCTNQSGFGRKYGYCPPDGFGRFYWRRIIAVWEKLY